MGNDAPEIPEPQRAPSEQPSQSAPDPATNGNGMTDPAPTPMPLDAEKLIEWMQATDKEIKMLRITQLAVCGAVLILVFTTAKVKVPSP